MATTDKSSVTSHTAKDAPAKPDPNTEEGRMLIGYEFNGSGPAGCTPLDFLKGDPRRHDPWGISITDLREGIEGVVLPPLLIWELGTWLNEVDNFPWDLSLKDDEEYCAWLVDGQGTPGAYLFRVYIVPQTLAREGAQGVKHPMMWRANYKKKGKRGVSSYFNTKIGPRKPTETLKTPVVKVDIEEDEDGLFGGWDYGKEPVGFVPAVVTPAKPVTPPAVKAPPLPAGVRFRCMCGHWWKESDLAGHMKVCPAIHGDDGINDWAIMCDDKCGCERVFGDHVKTLDHVSRCKPGYPRPPAAKKEVTTVSETVAEPPEEEATTPAAEPEPETTEEPTPETQTA